MAATSPTPMGQGSHFSSLGRRISARQALRRPSSRPQLSRSESNPVAGASAFALDVRAQSQQVSTLNDSSDDEIPVPMKLSALTKALLSNGEPAAVAPAPSSDVADRRDGPPQMVTRRRSILTKSTSAITAGGEADGGANPRQTKRHIRAGSAQVSSSRESSPAPRKRVIRLSTTPAGGALQSSVRRSLSASKHAKIPPSQDKTDENKPTQGPAPVSAPEQPAGVYTPATGMRRVQIAVGSSGGRGARLSSSSATSKRSMSAHLPSDHEMPDDHSTGGRPQGSASRFRASVRVKEGDVGPQSSMRVKRIGKVPGSFLSGPARRGRRRESEGDENRPLDDNADEEPIPSSQEADPRHQDAAQDASPLGAPYILDPAASGSPVSTKDPARAAHRKPLPRTTDLPASGNGVQPPRSNTMATRPTLPSVRDQENNVPHSAKGDTKPPYQGEGLLEGKLVAPLRTDIGPPPTQTATTSPARKVLGQLSRNTPHRPAPPPPPKMTVLETATATAGAATTAQANKKQRVLLKVNGRSYQRVDCIGRGGSAKVYKVTAENGKMLALKRVSLENADETTVKGYRGEIDLLRKLVGVDRVIQLFDWEMNTEKQLLSLLMEMGELDLNSLLRVRQNPESSRLDPVFTRFYWKEMLECLQAVHAHDIVHSDLKPANFVLVQGRLKLIDFGIANAIQTDETVNVHRETQVGTPNYMSPESLMDSQQYAFTTANNGRFGLSQGPKGPKLMKLGKPSDVWSLGCILYQMVYGQPPFGHIQNQMARCHAIVNWGHAIDFPDKGLGGGAVPASLVRTMRRCLNREQHLRPTCEELLAPSDPLLYPVEWGSSMENALPVTEELLGRIIQSVVIRCRDRMPTEGEALAAWPAAYWASVRKAVSTRDGKT